MIRQLAHICIHSNDLTETSRFYIEALGLEKGFDFIKDGELIDYYIKLGNDTFIEVFKGDPGTPGNINHLAIQADDMDAVIQRIKQHGYKIGEKALGADNSWQAWLEDPNGIRIEFHQYTEKSLQLTGGECIVKW